MSSLAAVCSAVALAQAVTVLLSLAAAIPPPSHDLFDELGAHSLDSAFSVQSGSVRHDADDSHAAVSDRDVDPVLSEYDAYLLSTEGAQWLLSMQSGSLLDNDACSLTAMLQLPLDPLLAQYVTYLLSPDDIPLPQFEFFQPPDFDRIGLTDGDSIPVKGRPRTPSVSVSNPTCKRKRSEGTLDDFTGLVDDRRLAVSDGGKQITADSRIPAQAYSPTGTAYGEVSRRSDPMPSTTRAKLSVCEIVPEDGLGSEMDAVGLPHQSTAPFSDPPSKRPKAILNRERKSRVSVPFTLLSMPQNSAFQTIGDGFVGQPVPASIRRFLSHSPERRQAQEEAWRRGFWPGVIVKLESNYLLAKRVFALIQKNQGVIQELSEQARSLEIQPCNIKPSHLPGQMPRISDYSDMDLVLTHYAINFGQNAPNNEPVKLSKSDLVHLLRLEYKINCFYYHCGAQGKCLDCTGVEKCNGDIRYDPSLTIE